MAQAVAPQAPVLMARTRDTRLITPAHGNMTTWKNCILALYFSEGFCSWCSFSVFIVTTKFKEMFLLFYTSVIVLI